MKTKTIKLLSLATAVASTLTNQVSAVIPPADSVVPESATNDAQKEEPMADVWAFQEKDGITANIVVRPATQADDATKSKILQHPALVGRGVVLVKILWEKSGECIGQSKWGQTEMKPQEYWQGVENRVILAIEVAARNSQPKQPTEQVADPAQGKPISVKHPNALITEVDVNSATVQKMRDTGCIIFTVFPSKVTAIGVITTEGLVLLDDMGGNRGLKYLSLGPLGPGVIIPSDPKTFVVNYGTTVVNPFKQAKVCEKVLKDTVKIVPGGKEVSNATKPLRDAVQQAGNIGIVGTTPNRVIDGLTQRPIPTLEKGVQTVIVKPAEQGAKAIVGVLKSLNPF